jgi:phage gp45-like
VTIRRGVIEQVADNEKRGQEVQVHGVANELLNGIEHAQPYGFTTVPHSIEGDGKGAECFLVDLFGATNRVVFCVTDRRYRPRVGEEGDVILYTSADDPESDHDNATCRLVMTANKELKARIGNAKLDMKQGEIKLSVGGAEITLSGGNVTFKGATITMDSSNVQLSP